MTCVNYPITMTGNPAKIVGEVPESQPTSVAFNAKNTFKNFKPKAE